MSTKPNPKIRPDAFPVVSACATPYLVARAWHERLRSHWTFDQVIAAHAHNCGHVHITPGLFVLARPVCREWSEDWLGDPQIASGSDQADCWHVWLLAGDMAAALKLMPYPLPFVSWHRRGVLKVHRLERVLRCLAK